MSPYCFDFGISDASTVCLKRSLKAELSCEIRVSNPLRYAALHKVLLRTTSDS